MRNNAFNVVLFVLLAGPLAFLFYYADRNWMPKPPPKPEKPAVQSPADALAALGGGLTTAALAAPPKAEAKAEPKPPVVPAAPAEPPTLYALGDPSFNNQLLLSSRGGGVQQVILPKDHEANRLGKEAKRDGQPLPLYLIPGTVRPERKSLADDPPPLALAPGKVGVGVPLAEPSYTLFHYAPGDDKYPLPDLGERTWKVVAEDRPADGPHAVTFETELGDPYFLTVRKTYTLGRKDYHAGLRVEFERRKVDGAAKGKGVFRYQLSGPRGLPIEGEWYTSTYRTALIGWTDDRGHSRRDVTDAGTVASRRGGDKIEAGGRRFQYMGVATQYFASAACVDAPPEAPGNGWWAYVRATAEAPSGVDVPADRQPFEDVTVRAAAEPLDLAPGEKVAHTYALYNGPAKVLLLKLLRGDQAVDEKLVDKYLDGFGLRSITDAPSPTALGRFANAIYWSDLVSTFTNLMHWLLAGIHAVLAGVGLGSVSWALSIVVLTVMVRLILFFPSRKQTQMNMKMMEVQTRLKPEIDKLHEKYKDDFHTFNREKTALMMKNGVNPFAAMGGCLLLFAQMPILMGLYYCLQESIFFRLEPFLWVENLAAPDMLVWWTEKIPMISTPDSLGGFLYMGPYFNILPILAVGLMMYQQNKMMPPPTDEMMASQQRMMKFMMLFMALIFYKMAAGLCVYFVVSTLWGILERRLVPKPVPGGSGDGGTGGDGGPGGTLPPKPPGPLGRFRDRLKERMEELQRQSEMQSDRQIRNGRNDGRGAAMPPRDRGDRKKKRRR